MRLVPLYDVNSIWPYTPPHGDKFDPQKLRLAMNMGNQYQFSFLGRKGLDTLARKIKVLAKKLHAWMDEMAGIIGGKAREVVKHSLEQGAPQDYMESIISCIEHEASRWLKIL
jgi:hypothetical protein